MEKSKILEKSPLLELWDKNSAHLDRDAVEYFDNIQNEYNLTREIPTKSCGNDKHVYSNSIYPKDCVPESLFVNPHNDKHYKWCLDCRKYHGDTPSKKPKIADSPDEHGVFKCIRCNSMRITEFCNLCNQRDIVNVKQKREQYRRLLWKKILEIGSCCEMCNQSFKRNEDESPGFTTVTGLLGLTAENVEYRNLVFDHLTHKEQIIHFGQYRGPKKGGCRANYFV